MLKSKKKTKNKKKTHSCFDERQKINHEKQVILILQKDKKETLTFFLAKFQQ